MTGLPEKPIFVLKASKHVIDIRSLLQGLQRINALGIKLIKYP